MEIHIRCPYCQLPILVMSNEINCEIFRHGILKKNHKHVFHQYVVYHPKRNLIIKELKKHKIEININYPFPIHKMEAYSKLVFNKYNSLPVTEKMAKGIFSLPLYPKLKENKVLKITKILQKILRSI